MKRYTSHASPLPGRGPDAGISRQTKTGAWSWARLAARAALFGTVVPDPRYNFDADPSLDEIIAQQAKGPITDLHGDFWPEEDELISQALPG